MDWNIELAEKLHRIGACTSSIRQLSGFQSAQQAWDNWEIVEDLVLYIGWCAEFDPWLRERLFQFLAEQCRKYALPLLFQEDREELELLLDEVAWLRPIQSVISLQDTPYDALLKPTIDIQSTAVCAERAITYALQSRLLAGYCGPYARSSIALLIEAAQMDGTSIRQEVLAALREWFPEPPALPDIPQMIQEVEDECV